MCHYSFTTLVCIIYFIHQAMLLPPKAPKNTLIIKSISLLCSLDNEMFQCYTVAAE